MKKFALIAVCLLGLTTACGGDDSTDSADSSSPESSIGTTLANPATEYCIQQGGTPEVVDGEGGQVGYCNLPDGTRIEEWEYFNAQSKPVESDLTTAVDPDFAGQVGWYPSVAIGADGLVIASHMDRENGE